MEVLGGYLEAVGWEDGRGEEGGEGVRRRNGVGLHVRLLAWLCVGQIKAGRGSVRKWEENRYGGRELT